MLESAQASLTDKRSKVLADSRTSQLVVVATENEQEAAVSLVNQLDKPTRQVLIETKLVEVSSKPQTTKGVDWSGTLAAQHVSFGNGFLSSANTAVQIPGKVLNTTFLGTGKPSTPGSTIPGSTTTTITPGTSGGFPTTTTVVIPDTVIPGTPAIPNATMNTTPDFSRSSSMDVSGGSGFSWNTLSGLTPSIGFLSADGASAVLSFLNQSADAQIISTPRVVTLDNQMATIEVTASYPIINLAGGTQNSSGSSSVTYSNVGTILQVTPRISANDYIWLKVIPVVSSHFGDITVTIPGGNGNASTSYPVPEFDYRKIDSQVMIPNGNTLVMGGLVQDNPTAQYTKVPLLGDIPGLGWAFRSESKTMVKDNLIIFMTPTIIRNTDFQQASSASADFLQSKPAVMKSRMNPSTVWDGAEPRGDWSNPVPVAGEFDNK
jgi:type II secretory pathway component GspD/PulD (secretin)